MALSEPSQLTVGAIREWLAQFPSDALLVVDDEAAGSSRTPTAMNGPWRMERLDDGSIDYWQDNAESAAEYRTTVTGGTAFENLPLGVVVFPR